LQQLGEGPTWVNNSENNSRVLGSQELQLSIRATMRCQVNPPSLVAGMRIIQEGDAGDALYVVTDWCDMSQPSGTQLAPNGYPLAASCPLAWCRFTSLLSTCFHDLPFFCCTCGFGERLVSGCWAARRARWIASRSLTESKWFSPQICVEILGFRRSFEMIGHHNKAWHKLRYFFNDAWHKLLSNFYYFYSWNWLEVVKTCVKGDLFGELVGAPSQSGVSSRFCSSAERIWWAIWSYMMLYDIWQSRATIAKLR
jgi:hypothetical protein